VFVVLRASAGEVKGQFFIDDQYVATPLIAGGNEQLLTEIPLKPGETTLLKIKGMPLMAASTRRASSCANRACPSLR